ncbi:DUF2846 domain-containing protein [Glaciecola siphonariae]|uniref:DUF2846 domain-containing protein n=1 Tax=Glaciecola siphonariae TaxID=521012 RepID=A0ABV9LTG8_9ALTE
MNYSKFLIVLLSFILSACAARGQPFQNLVEPAAGNAVIYLMRDSSFVGGAYCPNVEVNEEKVGCLKQQGFIRIEVPAGNHKVCFCKGITEIGDDVILALDLSENEVRFFEWIPEVGEMAFVGSNVYATGGKMESIIQHNRSEALSKLSNYKRSN